MIRKNIYTCLVCLVLATSLISCDDACNSGIESTGPEVIRFKVLPFDIQDVKLHDGPFMHATELNIKSLLKYDPDRLLAKFRIESGLTPKAEHYGGWEDETLAGHSLGHFLSACALMYNTTGDSIFLERVNYIVAELEVCQNAEGSGYLGAVPGAKDIFDKEIVNGDIRSQGFNLNGIWAPIYTQHKIMAGLLDAYTLCDNKASLPIAKRFADWMGNYMSKLTEDQIQEMFRCEYGGINESLAELSALTGEQKYMDLAYKYYDYAILTPLANRIDILPGKHANTQIPKLIGLARIYELTGDTSSQNTAKFFYDRVVHHHTYTTGGHCDHEYFGPPDTLRNRLSESTTETCNVYNMLKLSRHLFEWEASPEVADFYERALLNHILSSQHPVDGRVIYNLSLEMGGYKDYQDPEWFTCCVGTGMETHSKYAANIYYHNTDELYVAQYIASEVKWAEKGVSVQQKTKYPEEQGTTLSFQCDKPTDFALKIRYPYWAEEGIELKLNGKNIKVKEKASSFICINRTWSTGDTLEIKIPFSIRYESMPDDENRISVMYGPLVLAGDLGEVKDSMMYDPMFVPVFITEKDQIKDWIKPVEGEINTFATQGVGQLKDVVLKPFYSTHDKRYSVFWDIFTEEKWKVHQDEYKAKLEEEKKIEALTIDFFQPGEMQPERDHNFKDENSWVGEHKRRKYRETGGWLSFTIKTNKIKDLSLLVQYWGGFPGSKTFDILVDDTFLATENISNKNSGEFLTARYELPQKLVANKEQITVMLKAHDGHRAGPIFGVRTIKNE